MTPNSARECKIACVDVYACVCMADTQWAHQPVAAGCHACTGIYINAHHPVVEVLLQDVQILPNLPRAQPCSHTTLGRHPPIPPPSLPPPSCRPLTGDLSRSPAPSSGHPACSAPPATQRSSCALSVQRSNLCPVAHGAPPPLGLNASTVLHSCPKYPVVHHHASSQASFICYNPSRPLLLRHSSLGLTWRCAGRAHRLTVVNPTPTMQRCKIEGITGRGVCRAAASNTNSTSCERRWDATWCYWGSAHLRGESLAFNHVLADLAAGRARVNSEPRVRVRVPTLVWSNLGSSGS